MGLIRLEPAALKQAARDLDLAQARLDSVDRLICEIAPAIEYNWQSELTPEYLEYLSQRAGSSGSWKPFSARCGTQPNAPNARSGKRSRPSTHKHKNKIVNKGAL